MALTTTTISWSIELMLSDELVLSPGCDPLTIEELKTARQLTRKSLPSDSRTKWLDRARKMPVAERVLAIEERLRKLSKTPTSANVFFRKKLLRMLDESRVEAGLVTRADLQKENSPFAGMDFKTAHIQFRPRSRA